MSSVIKLNARPDKIKLKFSEDPQELINAEAKRAEEEEKRKQDKLKRELEAQYKAGYDEGVNSVKEEFEQKFLEKAQINEENFKQFSAAVTQLLSAYDSSLDQIITDVSLSIAEKVIRHELEDKSDIIPLVKDSVKKVLGANEITLKVNPEDISERLTEELNKSFEDGFAKIKIEKDERIEKGGCYIQTDIGSVDARLQTQLSELRRNLEKSFNA
jgi:flagellar assembly protein FliH